MLIQIQLFLFYFFVNLEMSVRLVFAYKEGKMPSGERTGQGAKMLISVFCHHHLPSVSHCFFSASVFPPIILRFILVQMYVVWLLHSSFKTRSRTSIFMYTDQWLQWLFYLIILHTLTNLFFLIFIWDEPLSIKWKVTFKVSDVSSVTCTSCFSFSSKYKQVFPFKWSIFCFI